ncbi:hypothetical protein FRC09_017032 [Ceratobasidium sp. 395]|nr:hypothetical protein FRC09_017032 [Ceratobasidium sp. 395]
MASRTLSSGAQPTTALMNHSSTANAASTTAASLAHMTDRAAQEFGLSGQALQMLHVFAVQCTPKLDALWTYASILCCMSLSQTVINKVGRFETKLNKIKAYVQEEYHLTKSQEIMLKKLMRCLACTSKTLFLTLPDCTKVFVTKNGSTFGLDLYTLNNEHVKLATDQFINSYGHQVRGTFRKAIFSEVKDSCTLELASHRVCTLMSAEVGNPPPKFVQACIAQLQLIAHKVMADLKKKEQATATQAGLSAN